MDHIFQPGRFSLHSIARALNVSYLNDLNFISIPDTDEYYDSVLACIIRYYKCHSVTLD